MLPANEKRRVGGKDPRKPAVCPDSGEMKEKGKYILICPELIRQTIERNGIMKKD